MKGKHLLAAILGAWALAGVAAWTLPLPVGPVDLEHILEPPGAEAWLGYDELGRPVGARLIAGAANSLLVCLLVVLLSILIGVPVGISGAMLGGYWDRAVVFLIDTVMSFPGLLLAIALTGLLGPGPVNAIIALTAAGWVGFARLARAQTLSLRSADHVQAARALGCTPVALARRHVLPLLLASLSVQASFELAGVIIAESTLSFLGLGIQPPEPSLGGMVLEGSRYMLVAPHLVLSPVLVLLTLVITINLLGDHMRDHLDVRGAVRPETTKPADGKTA